MNPEQARFMSCTARYQQIMGHEYPIHWLELIYMSPSVCDSQPAQPPFGVIVADLCWL